MSAFAPPVASSVVLDGVDWATYEKLLEALNEQPLWLTYDRGRLEIMAPLRTHEDAKSLLIQLVQLYAAAADSNIASLGSMTCRRADLARGLEPDGCFYLANEPRVRVRRELDFTVDPPPDLAIEIDATRSSLDRLGIYAALGVPEVWRYAPPELHIYRLQDAAYQPAERSLSFPRVTPADLLRFIGQLDVAGERQTINAIRAWAAGAVAPGEL